MPDNNRKVLHKAMIDELNSKYRITYDAENNTVNVGNANSRRITKHNADYQFHILCKPLGIKVVFSLDAINIWKNFQNEPNFKQYTLFDVNNIVNKLKVMYLPADEWRVKDMLKENFSGIKRI